MLRLPSLVFAWKGERRHLPASRSESREQSIIGSTNLRHAFACPCQAALSSRCNQAGSIALPELCFFSSSNIVLSHLSIGEKKTIPGSHEYIRRILYYASSFSRSQRIFLTCRSMDHSLPGTGSSSARRSSSDLGRRLSSMG